jgi:hypothetical protein
VKKRTILVAGLIIALFLIAMAESSSVKFAQANPYANFYLFEKVPPPPGSTPLKISVSSPKNNAIYNVSSVTLAFDVSNYETSIDYITNINYSASWLQENVIVWKQNSHSPEFPDFWSYNETFWNLPDGNYHIEIAANGWASYEDNVKVDYFWGTVYSYEMTSVLTINFTVADPPKVSILSLENETFASPDVRLNFTVNESVSRISYALDGQENMTVSGNMTLTNLSNGLHNVTVYAVDEAGNVGASETVCFSVDLPVLTTMIAALITSFSVIGASLLVYFKKRKR